MEKAKVYISYAEHFLHNEFAKQSYRQLYPESASINNYLISSSQIKDDVKCSSCFIDSDQQTFIFCIACDRVFHERCTKLDFFALKEESLPWICHLCISNPMNSAAKALVCMNRHLLSFKDRILLFITSPSAQQGKVKTLVPIEDLSYEELLEKFNELQVQYNTIVIKNESLRMSMQNNSKVIEQCTNLLQSISIPLNCNDDIVVSENQCAQICESSSSCLSTQSSKPYSSSNSDEFKYLIKDIETARFIGYDLRKVKKIPMQCVICKLSDHFSIQCRTYREMEIEMRLNLVKQKNLCINCMIATSHTAKDCRVKVGCGYRINKNMRCSTKHHISLHRDPSFKLSNKAQKDHQSKRNARHKMAVKHPIA